MKIWSADNPKAKMLQRKRDAILAAAKRQFLANGYGGTTMETIAADAGVSIMTLYRHAEGKDDLFAAVVGIACHDPNEPAPDLSNAPLADILHGTAMAFQEKLSDPDTIALLRAVIAEHERFPELATIAYDAMVLDLVSFLASTIVARDPTQQGKGEKLTALMHEFVDRLVGADMLRLLLGFGPPTTETFKRRAEGATAFLMRALAD